ncbi:MAG: hypothetical protein IPI53_00470 [Saprospiraceae bacterium]|nr:hypothetical protein [Saprospiraceae bacterium]
MTLRTVLLFLFVCVNVFYANSQKVNVGVHLGMTTTKMLWADKMDDEPWSAIQYPETQFRTSYSAGFSVDYLYNSRFYSPFQLDFYNKRFSISTGGVVQAFHQGQWIAIRSDYLDYRLSQLAISGGIGYLVYKQIGVEILPYIHVSLTDQEIKVEPVIDWQKTESFQQDFDYGISGYLSYKYKHIYVKAGYQYGLRSIREYSGFDAVGAFIGKFPIRNTMFFFLAGYRF